MEALQYIYTSWKNGDSTEKGYMIYSRSEGITEAECNAIKDAMQYLAPKELTPAPTPQEIDDLFPYAFSYFLLPTGRGCVAQSTYLGKDYSGRYGNYIIYALVFEVDDLPCRPAELFAEPYIKTAMTQEELDAPSPVPPLPPLEIDTYASVINDDQLNEFLFDKEEEFAQLVSMILASQESGVPFYLNDSRENLVLWSAAVQRMLPPSIAKHFTFNTYVGDHEFMRSARAKEQGLHFHLIGVRPDANYFNYATECRSNRQLVMDFLGGHMTEGVAPNSYAQAMASAMTMDFDEVDAFGEFVDSTSFREINGGLQDAYLCYHLLKNDAFEFSEESLSATLTFASTYCSESDKSDIAGKLLVKCQEEGWMLGPKVLPTFWKFVGSYAGFMIFTLFDVFTEIIYQHAGEATDSCEQLDALLQTIQAETPQQYGDYLAYLDSANGVERLMLYLSEHGNPFTNGFYITWLLKNYSFSDLSDGRPVSNLLLLLLKNIIRADGCEKQMIEILLTTAGNRGIFGYILGVFMEALREPEQLEQLCIQYAEAAASLPEEQLNRFERLLLDTPGAAPLATRLCARKIASSKKPEEEFWLFYDRQRSRLASDSGFALDPMILACLRHVDEKARGDVAVEMVRKIDSALIAEDETVRVLTDAVNDCSIRSLAKLGNAFLEQVCELRARVGESGLEKVKAVYVGEMLTASNAQHKRPVSLSGELVKTGITLTTMERSDYEAYIKTYFDEHLVLIQAPEDIPALMKIFFHGSHFSAFLDDYISAVKKMEKKEPDKAKRILGWTCVYLVTAENSDQAAEELYKPFISYLRTLDENRLLTVRQVTADVVPLSHCEFLFDEVRRKEGLSEKLGNLFHKKNKK